MSGKKQKSTGKKSITKFSAVRFSKTELKANKNNNEHPALQAVKIYDLIEKPVLKAINEMCEEELVFETEQLLERCKKAGIHMHFPGNCNRADVYEFITKEFLDLETDPFDPASQVWNIEYAPFLPGSNALIRISCSTFLDNWLHQNLKILKNEMTDVFVTNKGTIKLKLEVLERIQNFFKGRSFSQGSYYFSNVGFNWDEENNIGTGYAEGVLKYFCCSGTENKYMEGAFKFYLINENDNWEIFYFLIPGYSW